MKIENFQICSILKKLCNVNSILICTIQIGMHINEVIK